MNGPMDGLRVVELGFWVAGPSAGGVLADWGADVIKIEPPTGDPFRGLFAASGVELGANPPFELDNRSKRSICLDLTNEEGRRVALEILDRADVFLSNVRAAVLAGFGLDYESLSERNPRLVYASLSGLGELTTLLDAIFATRTRAEWAEILDREGMWWAPVQSVHEVLEDPQAAAAGAFVDGPLPDGSEARTVASPLDFSETPWSVRGAPPELGQHTEEVLLDLGFEWDAITKLKAAGAIP